MLNRKLKSIKDKVSQRELAKLAGVSQYTISKMYKGVRVKACTEDKVLDAIYMAEGWLKIPETMTSLDYTFGRTQEQITKEMKPHWEVPSDEQLDLLEDVEKINGTPFAPKPYSNPITCKPITDKGERGSRLVKFLTLGICS